MVRSWDVGWHVSGAPCDLDAKSILHKHIWERHSVGGSSGGGMETRQGTRVINSTRSDSATQPSMSEVISDGDADEHCSGACNV